MSKTQDAPIMEKTFISKTKKIQVLIGPSGCGKTKYASDYIRNNPGWVRVSRDDIRDSILGKLAFGEYFLSDNKDMERHVTSLQIEQIRYWLQQNYNVIIDSTHLKASYLKKYQEKFGHMAEIIFVPITSAQIDVCKERIKQIQGENADVKYIESQFHNFNELLKSTQQLNQWIDRKNPVMAEFRSLQKDANQECIIVDVDGSIADSIGIRSAADGDKIHLDRPIEPVRRLIQSLQAKTGNIFSRKKGVTIIYLSGREEKWRKNTLEWLRDNEFPIENDAHLLMRHDGDNSPDNALKQSMLMEIAPNYKPLFVIDDRISVCHNVWYKAGVFTLNVNQGLKLY